MKTEMKDGIYTENLHVASVTAPFYQDWREHKISYETEWREEFSLLFGNE